VAKKTDELSARERLLQLRQERETLEGQVQQELEGQLEELLAQFDEFGFELPAFLTDRFRAATHTPVRTASKKDRQPRSCKICRAAGRDDLAPGHTARGHEKFLETQSADI
jgi:hypothetical protein